VVEWGRGARQRGVSTAAGGGCRGGAGSGEVGARGGQQATHGGSTGPRGVLGAQVAMGTAGGGGSPGSAVMVRRAVGRRR
jgi:hypothetical protein